MRPLAMQTAVGKMVCMKLNFWQWLGVALLLLGVIWLVMRERGEKARTTRTSMSSPVSTPAHFPGVACPTTHRL